MAWHEIVWPCKYYAITVNLHYVRWIRRMTFCHLCIKSFKCRAPVYLGISNILSNMDSYNIWEHFMCWLINVCSSLYTVKQVFPLNHRKPRVFRRLNMFKNHTPMWVTQRLILNRMMQGPIYVFLVIFWRELL